MARLLSPNGTVIVGTLDRMPGCAQISDGTFRKGDKPETFEFDYEGETEVFWDDQSTVTCNGQRVFLDEEMEEWLEGQCRLETDEPEQPASQDRTIDEKLLADLFRLGNEALTLEWGTEDQVDAFNAFNEMASQNMTKAEQEAWDAYSMKATQDEIIKEALRILLAGEIRLRNGVAS